MKRSHAFSEANDSSFVWFSYDKVAAVHHILSSHKQPSMIITLFTNMVSVDLGEYILLEKHVRYPKNNS